MPLSLLDRLVELIKHDYPADWERFCRCAQEGALNENYAFIAKSHQPLDPVLQSFVERFGQRSPEKAARTYIRSYQRRASPGVSVGGFLLLNRFLEHFADVFRDQMVGRIKGTPEMKRLDPALISAGAIRFEPDELVLDEGELIIVNVRVEPAPTPLPNPSGAPIKKLMGKEWILVAFERRRNELSRLTITKAGGALAEESKTASDCSNPLSEGYCTNELRKLGIWKPQLTHSPKPSPSR
jgi:hypothetical protein